MKKLFFFFLISAFGIFAFAQAQTAQAQAIPDPVCIAKALAPYMNAVTTGKRNRGISQKILIGSPIFNLTNPIERQIFDEILNNGGDFNSIEAWLGNTYTTYPGNSGYTPNNTALGHYVDTGWTDGRFVTLDRPDFQKPVYFTEFGELNIDYTTRRPPIGQMQQEFNKLNQFPEIKGVAYFNALGLNPSFPYHTLSSAEFQQITGGSSKAGAHSAVPVVFGGGFIEQLKQHAPGAGVAVEILSGYQDPAEVAKVANLASSKGVTLILRLCTGDECYYSDPNTLLSFLSALDSHLAEGTQVIVSSGPNEPATEQWGAPGCYSGVGEPFDVQPYIPCNQTHPSGKEFHSLRPYPASPCNQSIVADDPNVKMCGQDLVIKETFKFASNGEGYNCQPPAADGSRVCEITVNRTSNLAININNAQLPIMGNTEIVTNSTKNVSPSNTKTHFAKLMNEYASWYLNGVTSRAEEEDEFIRSNNYNDPEIQQRLYEVINLSGPLRKLLPFAIQNIDLPLAAERLGLRALQLGKVLTNERHNQIVVCTPDLIMPLPTSNNPIKCYFPQDGRADTQRLRINSSGLQAGVGTLPYLFDNSNPLNVHWRFNPLYSFIPFSSTEDLAGQLNQPTNKAAANVTDVNLTFTDQQNRTRTLYFPHMQEVSELSEALQNTYRSKNEPATGKAPQDQFNEQKQTPNCEILESRTNPGDSLYGNLEGNLEDRIQNNQKQATTINASLNYQATFTCTFGPDAFSDEVYAQCMIDTNNADDEFCRQQATTETECTQSVSLPFNIEASTPKADDVWDRMVAGSMSIVKRIFPKVGPNTPIEEIEDIPGHSTVSYSNAGSVGGPVIESQTLAGDPNKNQQGSSAKLFFPHLGSVQEYFLYGIQKALRPKGAGELPSASPLPEEDRLANCNNVSDEEIRAINPNYLGSFKANFIDLANRWTNNSPTTNNAAKCYNDVVKRANAAGINPIFALTIWLNESGASNYAASSGPSWQDFGINVASVAPPQNFSAQLTAFLNLAGPGVYKSSHPQCFDGRYSDLQTFMYIFHLGTRSCTANPRADALTYFSAIFGTQSASGPSGSGPWNWVSRGCNVPTYTNDRSCQPR